jgi:hypothetical protein
MPEHGLAAGGCGEGEGEGEGPAEPARAYETHTSLRTVVALPSLNVCHLHAFFLVHALALLQFGPALSPKEWQVASELQLASATATQPSRPALQYSNLI